MLGTATSKDKLKILPKKSESAICSAKDPFFSLFCLILWLLYFRSQPSLGHRLQIKPGAHLRTSTLISPQSLGAAIS